MKKHFVFSLVLVLVLVVVFGFFGTMFALLFPLKFEKDIKIYAKEYYLTPELVASVINVESGFDQTQVSNVGAIGLMQLMPSTALEIADKLMIENFKIDDLYDPTVNIRFGCFYLRYLLDFYNDNLNNALASYNAGLSNVNSWLINSEYSADGENLNNIPYKETRNFVNKIYNNLKVYKYKF